MKNQNLISEPVEHIDPARLAFYLTWESRSRKNTGDADKAGQNWRIWLSAIGLSLGLTIITFLAAV